jgi:hypothetical protein
VLHISIVVCHLLDLKSTGSFLVSQNRKLSDLISIVVKFAFTKLGRIHDSKDILILQSSVAVKHWEHYREDGVATNRHTDTHTHTHAHWAGHTHSLDLDLRVP